MRSTTINTRSKLHVATAFLAVASFSLGIVISACSSAPAPQTNAEPAGPLPEKAKADTLVYQNVPAADSASSPNSGIPESYKSIEYPEFKYVAPYPKDYRVEVAPGIVGYIVSDRSLPLVNFSVSFDEKFLTPSLNDEAAANMVGSMFRRGGGGGVTAAALDDTLEFISAGISTSVNTYSSSFGINCLSKDFTGLLALAKQVLTAPAFDAEQLEIVKANAVTAYDRRYDTPAKILSALKAKVNFAPNPRLWDATADEYKKVSADDVKRLSEGVFSSKKIIFSLSGDVDRDSAVALLKDFFAGWNVSSAEKPTSVQPLSFLRKPGIYVVDRDVSQANIAMNQPFVKRPHEDYYPAAVASFILGGGSFTSRLMNRVRSDEGLAYSIYSTVGNNYRDTAMTTIALQTKVESVDFAMKLIFEEIEKLVKDGPTEEELVQAKKALIESLPSLFDSPASTAGIFADGEMLGKSFDHYLDYVKEINAVTADQVKAMVAKYFDRTKMTISIVAPVAKLDSLKPFAVVPLDSLEFRD